ncbi:GAF domain-containing protein [Amnibacterium kyonggiense]|uniref:GAF domain-containing protein n=1 Tax=Amnibacterium kyonggiense TaxID=595671 RepID=A0A4R7FRM7_9MICO|nr:GAF domain-containing protein [Amnibacterium kyonggiense]TDS80453.1 GAF domain-containing protein [Amnibacterium kyonggiense]
MDHNPSTARSSRLAMQRLHHSGARPVRVLLIGDRAHLFSAVDGSTVAERAADRMWLSTQHGVDLDVLTDLAPVLHAVQGVFRTWRLWRYDVVLVALGEGLDAGRRPRTLSRVGDLLTEVLEDAAAATDVVVVGPPVTAPDRSRHAAAPEDRLRAVVGRLGSVRVRFRAVDRGGDELARARAWATALGEEVAASVTRLDGAPAEATAEALRQRPDPEAQRQHALDELRIVGRPPEPRLDDLVELARAAFGTASAEINFIDHDRQWKMAVAGAERGENPRAHSFCTVTIQRATPLVVSDAMTDPVLRESPLAQGEHPIRFYAAHPIESTDGYRIGSFCIYDPEPRDVSGLDLSVLRDLALLAQAEITGADAAPTGVAPALATARSA